MCIMFIKAPWSVKKGLMIMHGKELKAGNRISIGLRDLESVKDSVIDPNNWPNEKIIINKYDALDKFSAKEWVGNTVSKFGGFDTLINCSGVLSKVPFLYNCLLYTSPSPRDRG